MKLERVDFNVDNANIYNLRLQKTQTQNVFAPNQTEPLTDTFKTTRTNDGFDSFSSSSNSDNLKSALSARLSDVTRSLEDAEEHNGFIGKAWNWAKNTFGFGASSNKVRKAQAEEQELLKDFEKNPEAVFEKLTGEPYSEENMRIFLDGGIKLKSEQALDGYKEGQEECSDFVADIASGILSFAAYSLALAAAPFTGGVSIAVGAGVAAAVGGLTKSAIKFADAKSGGKEYDSFTRDMVTGVFSGLLAPVTGGVGGAVGKTLASKLGLEVLTLGGKSVAKSAGGQVIKQGLKTMLTNPAGYTYAGGSLLKRGAAYGVEMMVDGALGGAIDNGFRTAYDGGGVSEILDSAKQGFVGGAIISPIIGGGFKVAGHAASAAEGALKDINFKGLDFSEAERKALDKLNARILSVKKKVFAEAQEITPNAPHTTNNNLRIRKPRNIEDCFNEHVNHFGIDLNSNQISGGHNSAFYPDLFVRIGDTHNYSLRGNPLSNINSALRNIDTPYNRASGNYRVRRINDKVVVEFEFTSREHGSIYREMNADGSFTLPKSGNLDECVDLPASNKITNVYNKVKQDHIDNLAKELGFDVNSATFSDINVKVDDSGVISIDCTYKQNGQVKSYKFTPIECEESGLKIYRQSYNGVDFDTPKTACDGKLLDDITRFLEDGADNFVVTTVPDSRVRLFKHEGINFQVVIDDSGNLISFYPVTRDFIHDTYPEVNISDIVDLTNIINLCNNTTRKGLEC